MLMRASGGDHFAAWGACRWQKRDKRPLTRCRLPAPRSLAIKLRTGRGQTEEKAAASERERERAALYFCLFISPFVHGLWLGEALRAALLPGRLQSPRASEGGSSKPAKPAKSHPSDRFQALLFSPHLWMKISNPKTQMSHTNDGKSPKSDKTSTL